MSCFALMTSNLTSLNILNSKFIFNSFPIIQSDRIKIYTQVVCQQRTPSFGDSTFSLISGQTLDFVNFDLKDEM